MASRRLRWLTLFAFASLDVAPAYAQETSNAAPNATGARYEDLIHEAVREHQAGHEVEARALFEAAHTLRPSARTLRGLGFCAYELRHYVQAIGELQAALDDTRNALTPAQRNEVMETLTKAKRFVGKLIVDVEPPDAHVQIDGQEIGSPQRVLDAGDYTLAATAHGYRDDEQRITVASGKTLTAHLRLIPAEPVELSPVTAAQTVESAGSADSPSVARPVPTTATATAETRHPILQQWWFWTAAGVVVAGAAIAVGLAVGSAASSQQPLYQGSAPSLHGP